MGWKYFATRWYLAEIVEVVLVVDPAKRRSFVKAVGLVNDVTDIAAHAMVQHPLEQLNHTHEIR